MQTHCTRPIGSGIPLLPEPLPLVDIDTLLSPHGARIDRLIKGLGVRCPEIDHALMRTIRKISGWIHLLPASEAHHHAYPGGLLEHSLDVAIGSSQAAQARLGDLTLPGWERRRQEDAFTLAAALSGLCHDLGKPLSDLIISHPEHPSVWNPYRESLIDWGMRHALSEYAITWVKGRSDRHRGFALVLLREIIDPELMDRIRNTGQDLEASLVNALTDGESGSDALSQCILDADADSARRSLKDPRRHMLGMGAFGSEVQIIHAVRQLLKTGVWKPNVPGHRLWIMEDAVHLAWPEAIEDIKTILAQDRLGYIPFDPDLLLTFMHDRGLVLPLSDDDPDSPLLFRIHPECLGGSIRVIRIHHPRLLFEGGLPPSVPGTIIAPLTLKLAERQDSVSEDPSPVDSPEIGREEANREPFESEDPSASMAMGILSLSDQIDWQVRDQRLFLPYPATAQALGRDPLEFVSELDALGWLDPSIRGALRKVTVIDSRRGILLTPERSATLLPQMKVPLRRSRRRTAP